MNSGADGDKKSRGAGPGLAQDTGCLLIIFLIITAVIWALIEPHVLTVTRITVKIKEMPEALSGLRIVQISDFHYGAFTGKRRLKKAVETANRLNPDLVVLTGDYTSGEEKNIAPCFEALKGLNSRYGVYTVLGNHDFSAGKIRSKQAIIEAGFVDLTDDSRWITVRGEKVKLIGMAPAWAARDFAFSALKNAPREELVILLTHSPEMLINFKANNLDLAFAGHTHGGQVTFFGRYAPFMPARQAFREGLIEMGDFRMIVSRGVGAFLIPMRFFCPPEVMLVTLEKEG